MRWTAHMVLLMAFAAAAIAQSPDSAGPDSAILKDFNRRVVDYVKLSKAAQSEIHRPKPTKSPEAIERYESRLAHRIQEARRGEGRGSIFTPEIADDFRRIIGAAMQGPQAARIQQSLRQDSVYSVRIRANRPYPAGLPLPSTPPSLLMSLPPLTAQLDYRVVGHNLILHDVDANLVVDFIPNAIP